MARMAELARNMTCEELFRAGFLATPPGVVRRIHMPLGWRTRDILMMAEYHGIDPAELVKTDRMKHELTLDEIVDNHEYPSVGVIVRLYCDGTEARPHEGKEAHPHERAQVALLGRSNGLIDDKHEPWKRCDHRIDIDAQYLMRGAGRGGLPDLIPPPLSLTVQLVTDDDADILAQARDIREFRERYEGESTRAREVLECPECPRRVVTLMDRASVICEGVIKNSEPVRPGEWEIHVSILTDGK